jgi:hypothetical protein
MIIILGLCISGCRETHSEEWFRQHPDDTFAVASRCLEEQTENDWNCEFAIRASLWFTRDDTVPAQEQKRFSEMLTLHGR